MDTSIFLAKVLGLYFFIMAIVMFMNQQSIKTMMNKANSTPFIFMSGAIALIMGILLIVSHNVWKADWRVLITIIGWLALVQGIVRLVFPEYAFKMITNFLKNTKTYYITNAVVLILGIYLSYIGFMRNCCF